jgi:hypothetical protein
VTRRTLRLNVIALIVLLLGLVTATQFSERIYATTKDFGSFFIAVAAAYLAYCFQRRQAFLASLRELWHACITAKADLLDYTHTAKPSQADFGKAARSVSVAIDMMRAVYRNIGETEREIGLYPFQPLHDMRRALDELGFTNLSTDKQKAARERVLQGWNALRWSFLREFSAQSPTHYITEYDAEDPRRIGSAHSDDRLSLGRPIRRFTVKEPPDKN